MSRPLSLAIGMTVCAAAAVLIVADVLSVGWGSAVGVIGLGIIATAGRSAGSDR